MKSTPSQPAKQTRRAPGWPRAIDPFLRFRDEIDEVFSHYLTPFRRADNENGESFAMPASLDISESKNTVDIVLDVPGVNEEDLDITLTDTGVLISGSRREESEESDKNYHRIERAYGAFQRHVPLPCDVDPAKVEAKLKKGVLKITLPKTEQAKKTSRKIAIKAS